MNWMNDIKMPDFTADLPELKPVPRPDAELTDKANEAVIESLKVLRKIEMNTEYIKDVVSLLSVNNEHQKELKGLVQSILLIAEAPDKEEAETRYRSVMKKIGDFSVITSSAVNIQQLASLANVFLQFFKG